MSEPTPPSAIAGVSDSAMKEALAATGGNVVMATNMALKQLHQEQKKDAAIENGTRRGDGDGNDQSDGSGLGPDIKIGQTTFSRKAFNEAVGRAREDFGRDPNFNKDPKLVDNAAKVATAAAAAIVDRERKPGSPENGDEALAAKTPEAVQKVKDLARDHPDFKDHLAHGKMTQQDNQLMCDALKGSACTRAELDNQKSGVKQQGIDVVQDGPVAPASSRPQQNLNTTIGPHTLPPERIAQPVLAAKAEAVTEKPVQQVAQQAEQDHQQGAPQRKTNLFAP